MIFRILFIGCIGAFLILCTALVFESGLFDDRTAAPTGCILLENPTADDSNGARASDEPDIPSPQMSDINLQAVGGTPELVTIGAQDPNTENPETGFRFQLILSTRGASIKEATFSNGEDKGFDDRDYKDPSPLRILSPVKMPDRTQVLSMANTRLVFTRHKLLLRLDRLDWKFCGKQILEDGSQTARFKAAIDNPETGQTVLEITKTYKVEPTNYMLDCSLHVENISERQEEVYFSLTGPVGFQREGVRSDMRKAVAAFRDYKNGNVISTRISLGDFEQNLRSGKKELLSDEGRFLWTAAVNKYFAGIVVPLPGREKDHCDWIQKKYAQFYNPDGRKDTKDENITVALRTTDDTFAPAGQPDSSKEYNFQVYIGPKDKRLFDASERYTELGFAHTIDFMACFCCPASIISPLAFGILAIMEWLYAVIGNYGVVIIVLVFIFRLVIHPLTKKSQVSMSKFGKIAPKMEEVKKKYANNKAEMNKQMMALYKEHGASPVMGMLPMLVQMPIWISLYSAIYASVALRGEPFLPVWITDLSAPDALIRFPAVDLPLFGELDSFNLLPILMGLAFFLQQKLMPRQAPQTTNSQMAQQQKMMMFMLPIMFPLLLYKAPSGLNLYIMASTFAGVIEQYFIRKHIREREQAEADGVVAATKKTGGKAKKKKPKPFYKNM